MRGIYIIVFALAGCGAWPDAGGGPLSRGGAWPELMPLDGLSVDTPEAEGRDAERLSSRAAGLRARAAILRRAVYNSDDMEALRARLAR